jgi:hypothetical protein
LRPAEGMRNGLSVPSQGEATAGGSGAGSRRAVAPSPDPWSALGEGAAQRDGSSAGEAGVARWGTGKSLCRFANRVRAYY